MPILPSILAILAIFFILFLRSLCNKFTIAFPQVLMNYYRLHDKIAELLEENNGSCLAKLTLFLGRDMLVTRMPADVQHILSINFLNYPKGPEWRKRFDIFGNGNFNTDFDEWLCHRKAIRLLFSHHMFKRLMGTVLQKCVKKELIPILGQVSDKELVVDFQMLMKRFVSYFSLSVCVGHKPEPVNLDRLEDDPLTKALDDASEAILHRFIFPVFLWKLMKKLNIGFENKYNRAWETIDHVVAQYASVSREEVRKEPHKDDLDDIDGEDFNALKLYLTGHEELRSVPNKFDIHRDNILALIHQLDKMVYLEAAINETLRLYPPVPYEVRSPIYPDILPSGHHVNKKTTIFISVYAMGRSKSLWGEDSHQFKPERWITEEGNVRYESPHKFFLFNAGPRICPGKDYAYVLLKTLIASVMQNFHVQVVKNQIVTPKISIVLQQKNGMKVMINKIA